MIFTHLTLAQAGGIAEFANFIPLILMAVVVYFFMIRPQQKRQKEQQAFIDNLHKGDEVVTRDGIFGKVMELETHTVILDIGKSTRMKVLRTAISKENSEVGLQKK